MKYVGLCIRVFHDDVILGGLWDVTFLGVIFFLQAIERRYHREGGNQVNTLTGNRQGYTYT